MMSVETDYDKDIEPTEEEIKVEQDSILDMLGFESSAPEETEEEENESEDGVEDDETETEETDDTTETEEDADEDKDTDIEDGSETETEVDGENEDKSEDSEADDDEVDDESELPPDELTSLREANKNLLKLIEDGVSASIGVTPSKKEKTIPATEEKTKEPSPSLAELIGDIDFNDMQEDPAKFVVLMQKVVDHTRQSTIDGLQADLPTIVNERATQAINLQSLVDNFYRDNEDLAVVKKTVSAVAQNVGAENPTWDMKQILEEAAKRTRSILGTKAPSEKAKAKPKRRGKKPAMPRVKGKRSKTKVKKTSKQQQQINDIIDY